MKERAELTGAIYAIDSTPGQGTRIRVAWPCVRAAEDDRAGVGSLPCGMQPGTQDCSGSLVCYCPNFSDANNPGPGAIDVDDRSAC
jgi:hypothetical protein